MRSLRCWLFGHEWIRTFITTTDNFQRTRMATCPRCGATTAFVDEEGDSDA